MVTGLIWEHWAPNRNGKTFLMAADAWEAWQRGRIVYCNCPEIGNGQVDHILNFPHEHLYPSEYSEADLANCYLLTDEAADYLDARETMRDKGRGNLTSFARQAKKRGVDWHYDCIRREDIEIRVRLNPDRIVRTWRIPADIKKPVQAFRVRIEYKTGGVTEKYLVHPERWFPVYNHLSMVRHS
jgi:hypothetical protein